MLCAGQFWGERGTAMSSVSLSVLDIVPVCCGVGLAFVSPVFPPPGWACGYKIFLCFNLFVCFASSSLVGDVLLPFACTLAFFIVAYFDG